MKGDGKMSHQSASDSTVSLLVLVGFWNCFLRQNVTEMT